jgi:trigger factor
MAELATDTLENDVTITDAGPSRKKLAITIPAEAVEQKVGDSLDTIAVEAAMPGFRKGHAPRALIERKFGEAVLAEAKNQLIAQAYTQAVEANKLKVLGDPVGDLGDTLVLERGKPLSFEIEVEVVPEFELPELEGLKIDKPIVEVTDEMVDSEIEKILVNEGRLEELEKAAPGDYLTGHAVMRDDKGNEHYNIEGAVIQVPTKETGPKGMILGLIVDDFAKQIGLPKPGDNLTVKTTGPDQHEIEGVRNADLTITFRVDRADRIVPAEAGELLERFGFESEDQLKDVVRGRMEQRVQIEQMNVMHQQAAAQLLDKTEITLPERLTAQQAGRILDRKRVELMHRGVEPQEVEQHIAELRAGSADAAVQELKLFFLLNAIAEKMEVTVNEAEVNGRIAQLAASRQIRPEALRQELIQTNRVGTVVQQIREHKAMAAVLEKAEITELPADEFNKKHAKKG